MNNSTSSEKNVTKKVFSVMLDIITIALLFAAFIMVFYTGFITEEENDMPLNVMSAVTAIGLILLFVIGTGSCLVTKAKKNCVTAGFLAFSAVQLYALLSNFVVLFCLVIGLFTTEDVFMQVSYLATTLIILIGYVANIIAFANDDVRAEASYDDDYDLIEEDDSEDADVEDEDEDEDDEDEYDDEYEDDEDEEDEIFEDDDFEYDSDELSEIKDEL